MTLLLIYLAIAIGVSFLCSILEAVLLSTTSSFVASLSADRPRAGAVLSQVKDGLDESLAAILILNTFAHTMGAFGVGAQALRVFGPQWETLIAVLLTLAILYFSEIIPKTLGATFWRALAVPAAFLILWLVKLVYPLVWVSTRLTKLFGRDSESEITREEIIAMASLGKQGGALVPRENEYLSNVLSLREISTEEVLTPRSVVHMLDQTTPVSAALDDPRTREFARMPIFGDGMDDICGKVLRNDLFIAEREGKGDRPISDFAKPILRVSEKLPVQQLLDLMIKNRVHLCLVEDEYGQTSGIVTLEDAIETLLGREIVDESDTVEDMQELARGKYRERLREDRGKSGENAG
jgi:CBS domain containing-hemolysin-like protein